MANRVKKVQQSLGIKADGYAGIDTLWALLPYTETDHPLYEEYIASAEYEANIRSMVDSYNGGSGQSENTSPEVTDTDDEDKLFHDAVMSEQSVSDVSSTVKITKDPGDREKTDASDTGAEAITVGGLLESGAEQEAEE